MARPGNSTSPYQGLGGGNGCCCTGASGTGPPREGMGAAGGWDGALIWAELTMGPLLP